MRKSERSVFQDLTERAYPQGLLRRDSDVPLPLRSLARHCVTQALQASGQLNTVEITRQFHSASSSCLTR